MRKFTLNARGGCFATRSSVVRDPVDAELTLRDLASDWEGRAYLRQVMQGHVGGRIGAPLDDRDLLRHLAVRLSAGELGLERVAPVHSEGGGDADGGAAAGAADAQAETPKPPPPKRDTGPSVTPSNLRGPSGAAERAGTASQTDEEWNADAQVAALIAAAASGAPFCEQCAPPGGGGGRGDGSGDARPVP